MLQSLFTKSAKKWYYKMRQDHNKDSWPWWKEQIISKWENDSWRVRMENSFKESTFNTGRDMPMSWLLKHKDRSTALYPSISETMNGQKPALRPDRKEDRAPLKCHKCGSTSHLASICPKWTRINDIKIENPEYTKEKNDLSLDESDSEPDEEEELQDKLSIENINVSFDITEGHTHLPRLSDESMDLIHVQEAKIENPSLPEEKVIQLDHLVSLIL
ncbi:hypothetical protein O181_052301 [Austropuccinia psidii MF-1]|uniref:CCHC-type domain-containing protein n=1 Tax=Austropuccinia psidii MF-1 TaxID=1389203 RepID=A0A9Q3E5B8_9BASI|nr:hypothetical protein [Austropuccinia psidii MF-1]